MNDWFADDRDPSGDGVDADALFGFDDNLVDQVLDATDAESLPAAFRPLADVLVAVRAPATEAELAGEPEAVARFRAMRTATFTPRRHVRRRTTAVVIAATLTLVSATGVAAATARLPDDVQDMASQVLSKLGIDVPRSGRDTPPDRRPSTDGGRSVSSAPVSSTTGETRSGARVSGPTVPATPAKAPSPPVRPARSDLPVERDVAAVPLAVQEDPPLVEQMGEPTAEPELAQLVTTTSTDAALSTASPTPTAGGQPATAPAALPPPEPDAAPTIADAVPASTSPGRPPTTPAGPPASVPVDPPAHAPAGPPASVPVDPPAHAPAGPPASVPVGPPISIPVDPPAQAQSWAADRPGRPG